MACSTCKSWTRRDWQPPWGECIRGRSVAGSPTEWETMAYGLDGDGYSAYLVTRFDFTCPMYSEVDYG